VTWQSHGGKHPISAVCWVNIDVSCGWGDAVANEVKARHDYCYLKNKRLMSQFMWQDDLHDVAKLIIDCLGFIKGADPPSGGSGI
jgi:hypothetical protein